MAALDRPPGQAPDPNTSDFVMKLLRRAFGEKKKKKTKSPVTQPDPEFPRLEGLHYLDFIDRFHQVNRPSSYLEIGSQTGRSLQFAGNHCIAVDPSFRLSYDVITAKESLYLYQGTSDDFFDSGYLKRTGTSIDFAFLDGMHLFEFLLRDFMHTERAVSGKESMIALHDCVPYARIMATRDWDKAITRSWSGDVWKMIPVLRRYRPDLDVKVLDCAPTGLVVVTNCDAGSSVLADNYDEILAEYLEMSLPDYGVERFVGELDLSSADAFLPPSPAL